MSRCIEARQMALKISQLEILSGQSCRLPGQSPDTCLFIS